MEMRQGPKKTYQNSQRFCVWPLPLWSLAVTKFDDGLNSSTGLGFDRSRKTAISKAESEAVERWVIKDWIQTEISPFTKEKKPPPPVEAGMAAHPNLPSAQQNAFSEWRERALLSAAWESKYHLKNTIIPPLGPLFYPLLKLSGISLRGYLGEGAFPLAITFGFLLDGVIFGSSANLNPRLAIYRATSECIRKIAFINSWRLQRGITEETTTFYNNVGFWLSNDGNVQAKTFIEKATKSTRQQLLIPTTPIKERLSHMLVNNLHICNYFDPDFSLPKISELKIPLI